MKSLLLEATDGIKVVDIHDFHDIVDNLKVGCFDVLRIQIGGDENAVYDVYCDDEGLLKPNPIVTAYNKELKPLLVGNLLIAQSNSRGEQIALTEDDIKYIQKFCVRYRKTKLKLEPKYLYCIIHSDYARRMR